MNRINLKLFCLSLLVLCTGTLMAAQFNVDTYPRLLVNQDAVEHARDNIENHEWAAENSKELIAFADSYKIPKSRDFTVKRGILSWKSLGFLSDVTLNIFKMALAWSITEDDKYIEPIKSLVTDVCNPQTGYIAVGAATTGVEVHEGVFFFYLAATCDILYSREDIFTDEQKRDIEATMRAYAEKSKKDMAPNGIMNHQASSNAAAVTVSMFLQDEELFDYFVESEGGMIDQIATGFMPDGWWFEGTINYCYLVADIYFRMAQIYQNNGMDLYREKFAAREMEKDFHNAKDDFTGMKFAVWGPEKPYRTFRELALAYYPMMDESGIVVASNDTALLPPAVFHELAYKEFGDKELAWVISKTKRDSWVSLFYGVGKLPNVKDPRTKSATLPNIGLTALRSQNKEKVGEEQLQAYVKFGSHGGWHGHFDRASLQALDKYGHKFFGTEMCWFGYISAEYKELVQTSAAHNMVVVDEMQQEAVPSSQPLFYAGKSMQISVTETQARWRPIPLNNIEKFPPWDDFDYATEPILQRRLALVTDDYLLTVDYISSDEQRQYDCLVHPLGFVAVDGAAKVGEVLPVINNEKASPYKYFKECQWYKGADNSVKFEFNDKGVGLDLQLLWPQKSDIFYAHYPSTTNAVTYGLRNDPDRRTVGVRVEGKDAVFINLMEPHQGESVIKSAVATADNSVTVTLKDGTVHTINIANLNGEAKDIKVEMIKKLPNGKSSRERSR
ncbi:MAG: alginate lyase family protein [Rikenellaceae bacterium]